ncbi:response regulator [Massiliimalia massiliensis]|uniref:response regulator n=1 Tax=Massiliimalia massiliensis TaxID=1852384 RepID=UPI000985CFB0|nr:response regulator [Massiliimalia massiliensis]
MSKSILIIEDEFYFRQALKKYIAAYSEEFEVCGEARNGQDGLEKLLDMKPDIALVDITMPVMDGITVIKKAKEAHSKTKVIILTGYGEFEYAKKAIQLGVQDYLLKPLQSDELYQSLQKASRTIDQERETENTLSLISGAKQGMFSAYKESMISKLLLNDFYDEEELERNFNFPKKDSLYVAAVLDIYIKNAEIWNQEDKKLCHYAICNVMGDIFKEAMSFGTCMNENGMICIVFRLYHEDNAELQLQERMEQVCTVAEDYLGLVVTAYFGDLRTSLGEVNESYNEALALKKYQLFHDKKGVYFYSDTQTKPHLSKEYFSREDRKQLLSLMRANNHDGVHALIRKVFAKMMEGNLDPDTVYMHVTDLFSVVLDFATEYRTELQKPNENVSLFSHIMSAPSLEQLQKFVMDAADRVMAQINQKDIDSQAKLAQKVAEYIDANFANPNLKLEIIAGEFYINIQYLCSIFKKHRSTTIGNYILDVRMGNAQRELLDGAESITVVAYHCGYEDVGYFSKCFKRYFGLSPKKFIEKHTKKGSDEAL